MDNPEIDLLLARFYEGTATEAEENMLKAYFAREDVPPRLRTDQAFFRQLARTDIPLPEGLGDRLETLIDRLDSKETRKRRHRRLVLRRTAGIAAMFCLLCSATAWWLSRPSVPSALTPQDTCATPEEAYRETQKALSALAYGLNRGVEGMKTVERTSEKVNQQLMQQLNHIKNLPQ